jgi:type II secretory pathway pseudopilin PulG
MKQTQSPSAESGFTLVEALVAMVVLVFGLIAVTNLLLVAGTSNAVANQSTAATQEASEVMERLKALPFTTLTVGGNLAAPTGSIANCDATLPGGANCVIPGNFNQRRAIEGVGVVVTLWQIQAGLGNQERFIVVRSQGTGALSGARSRAEFTTFRTCTDTVTNPNAAMRCPAAP